MLEKSGIENDREDLAISCLLEEDQKEILEKSDWQNPNSKGTKKNQVTSYMDFKVTRPRHLFNRNQQARGLRNRYNPQMLEATVFENSLKQHEEARYLQQMENQECSNEEKQGESWCWKVNWTSVGFKEPKNPLSLNKKYSMGNEIHLMSSRRSNTRYEHYDKFRDEEYKTNLIYNILQAQTERLKQQQIKLKSAFTNHVGRSVDVIRARDRIAIEHKPPKQVKRRHQTLHLSRYTQQSMRQALQKLWQQNYQNNESHVFSPNKKGETNRSSVIREILLNLERNKAKGDPLQKNSNDFQRESSNLLIKQRKNESKVIPDKTEHQLTKTKMNQVNINAEAERVYKSRSVNRKYVKKI